MLNDLLGRLSLKSLFYVKLDISSQLTFVFLVCIIGWLNVLSVGLAIKGHKV